MSPATPSASRDSLLNDARSRYKALQLPTYETIIVFSLGSLSTIAVIWVRNRYFRRIRTAEWVSAKMIKDKTWIKGVVTSVNDGDGFRLYHTPGLFWKWPIKLRNIPSTSKELKDETIHIRIAGIAIFSPRVPQLKQWFITGVDAPEMEHFGKAAQPYSAEALAWLRKEVQGKRLWVQLIKRDQYNRIVGIPIRPPRIPFMHPPAFRCISISMLSAGYAVTYEQSGAEYGRWGKDLFLKYESAARHVSFSSAKGYHGVYRILELQNVPLLNLLNDPVLSVNTTLNNPQANSTQYVSESNSQHSKHTNIDNRRRLLVDLPEESFGHIVTYIDDPSSLIALSQVNRMLKNYVADDNTWYRSFAYRYWGIGPENSPSQKQKMLLRRSESTWKKEFMKRSELLLRWEKSRSSTMSYQPHSWSINSMHLLDNLSMMTSNIQYGIVARSFPLTGKILRGFLDASGTANGFGIGNPNVEFSPHVSSIAMSSRGGTAHIAWGFRSGEVALTTAPRVMDSDRPASRYIRCNGRDEHPSQVRSLTFAGHEDELIISGCAHGQVKLWESKRMRCVWSGSLNREDAPPDACVKLVCSAAVDIIVTVGQSGHLVVWSGFQICQDDTGHSSQVGIVESTRILCPDANPKTVQSLLIDPQSDTSAVTLLAHYTGDDFFLRYMIDTSSKTVHCSRFHTEGGFPITALKPCFTLNKHALPLSNSTAPARNDDTAPSTLLIHSTSHLMTDQSSSFILAGDSLGRISIWNWESPSDILGRFTGTDKVIPCWTWDAHNDGSISSLEANNYIVVSGSSKGTIKVWDMLTLNPLRAFSSPITKPLPSGEWPPVNQIFIRDDLLITNIGDRVLVWQAKPIVSSKKMKVKRPNRPKGRGVTTATSKWQQQMELINDVKETKREIAAERARTNRTNGRVKAEQTSLDELGLTESEAVDYLLMLSREEEESRVTSTLPSSSSSVSLNDEAMFTLDGLDELLPRVPSSRVSYHPTWNTRSPESPSPPSSLEDRSEFPNIGSPSGNIRAQAIRPSGSWSRGSPASSWQSANATAASSLSASSFQSNASSLSQPSRRHFADEDAELRFVLELSLAEARSRGEA